MVLLGFFILTCSFLFIYMGGNDPHLFWDPYPLAFIVVMVLGGGMIKYGKEVFRYFQVAKKKQGEMSLYLGNLALVSGFLGSLMGCISILAHTDNPHSIGPSAAVNFLSTLYGVLFYMFFILHRIPQKKLEQQTNLVIGVLLIPQILTAAYFYWTLMSNSAA